MGAVKPDQIELFLSVDELCSAYRIHRATFYRWLADPSLGLEEVILRLPGRRRIRIPASRFREWVERVGAMRPTPAPPQL